MYRASIIFFNTTNLKDLNTNINNEFHVDATAHWFRTGRIACTFSTLSSANCVAISSTVFVNCVYLCSRYLVCELNQQQSDFLRDTVEVLIRPFSCMTSIVRLSGAAFRKYDQLKARGIIYEDLLAILRAN